MIWWWWLEYLLRQLSSTFGPASARGLQHRLHGPHFSRSAPAATSQRMAHALRPGALAPQAHRPAPTQGSTGKDIYIYIYIYMYIYTYMIFVTFCV